MLKASKTPTATAETFTKKGQPILSRRARALGFRSTTAQLFHAAKPLAGASLLLLVTIAYNMHPFIDCSRLQ
jgi:hypothetical protein